MNHLPKLTVYYWIMMLLCTTMGELIGNLISRNLELGYTKGAVINVVIFAFVVSLFVTLKLFNDIFYWLLILVGNIGGTNLADWVTLEPLANDITWGFLAPLQLGTVSGSLAVMGALILVLIVHYGAAKISARETVFVMVTYWSAILFSSTFGTTSGDFITNDTPLGALGGSLLLLSLLAITFLLFKKNIVTKPIAYWSALVLLHPVGATIGNWVSKPIGLDLGNVWTNVFMIALFFSFFLIGEKRNRIYN